MIIEEKQAIVYGLKTLYGKAAEIDWQNGVNDRINTLILTYLPMIVTLLLLLSIALRPQYRTAFMFFQDVYKTPVLFLLTAALFFLSSTPANAREYHIGPEKRYLTPIDFPWEGVLPGDIINIHYRAKPYKAKWVLSPRGTAKKPIVVRGVRGPKNERPVIDGKRGMKRPQLDYWNEERSLLKIGASRLPDNDLASYLLIEGLEFRGAKPKNFFIGSKGIQKYTNNAAGILIEKGTHITIRDCLIHDCGNGLFVSHESSNILIEGCEFRDNGVEGRFYEHNVYTAAKGITFQYNKFGPLRIGCGGNNLKDRSSGLIIRYNWIEGGNRQLDLVDAEDSEVLRNDPSYPNALVYGNVLVERENDGNNQIVHFGGDSGSEESYRNGTLYFYNNTIISYRKGKTVLFRLSTAMQKADFRNNIFWTPANGRYLAILDETGRVEMRQNWIKKGWIESHGGSEYKGAITVHSTITGTDPGFVNSSNEKKNFFLTKQSACKSKAITLPKALLPAHAVTMQFKRPLGSQKRKRLAPANLGAFGKP